MFYIYLRRKNIPNIRTKLVLNNFFFYIENAHNSNLNYYLVGRTNLLIMRDKSQVVKMLNHWLRLNSMLWRCRLCLNYYVVEMLIMSWYYVVQMLWRCQLRLNFVLWRCRLSWNIMFKDVDSLLVNKRF